MVITFGSTLIMPLQYAVFLGVVISILLFVFQQSNTIQVVEWDASKSGGRLSDLRRNKLESNQVTVLYIYGNLFYAAADAFEKSLPAVEGTRRPVVILLLRGYDDIGSTVIGVLHRYTQALQAHEGKLILAGRFPGLARPASAHRDAQLDRRGEYLSRHRNHWRSRQRRAEGCNRLAGGNPFGG